MSDQDVQSSVLWWLLTCLSNFECFFLFAAGSGGMVAIVAWDQFTLLVLNYEYIGIFRRRVNSGQVRHISSLNIVIRTL